jgi:acetolactate synthase-1/2/3 large subunit
VNTPPEGGAAGELITAGELLMRCLKAEGVDFMCGIVDGAHIPFVVHAPDYGVRYVNTHHEEAAVHIAEGFARLTHRPAVVIGNPGPGGANMLAGITSAFAEGHPVVAIACTRRSATTQPDRGGAWQATDLTSMAGPVTKHAALVTRADRLPELVRAAFRAATSGRPGPAFLAVPDEMLLETIDVSDLRVTEASRNRVVDLGPGDPQAIEQAAEWLAGAERPFLFAGKGVLWAEAARELVALGEHLAAAMSTSLGARGVVPEDHPHYFHLFDMHTTQAVRRDADVVVVVGARLGEYDGWGMPPAWGAPADQRTIQIDVDPLSIGLNRPVDLAIVGDAKRVLVALTEAVEARVAPRSTMADHDHYAAMHAETVSAAAPYVLAEPTTGVNPGQMVMAVREVFGRDAVCVVDGGNTTLWTVALHPILEPDCFLYSVQMGYLGTGLPFAIGAKLAAPDRAVHLITGDGAFGFNLMELETAVRVDAPVVCIVAVDHGWGMERSAHARHGIDPKRFQGTEIGPQIRYDRIAEALGAHGEHVTSIAELRPALDRAVASGLPAVVHVEVDPAINANAIGYEQFQRSRTL